MLEGLPPNNAAFVMRLRCPEAQARALADLVVETFDPAETAAAAFEEKATTESWAATPWLVEVYFGHDPDEANLRELATVAVGAELAAQIEFDRVLQKDWVAASLEGLSAVRAGRFVVHGSHDRASVQPNDIGLEIEAALAFGTGHHGTTRGCLLFLDEILKRRRPQNILDIGCGTGVLALAAARALRIEVAAGDIDADAVAATRANAVLNCAGPWLHPVQARGALHPALWKPRAYDLIFANILAKPLRMLAPSLAQLAAHGGDVVLSGMLLRDVPGVATAWAAQGFAIAKRRHIDGWATLLLRRGGA
ncbi:[LSU ribosomal protein L11P]-lysine N-methyltransferase [Rhodoblastus acidophilus]|uniref:Ribosomal protein L11 methyltransferase n=1 Tax=Rhodoblastus acidophilus TaxID=1074 RepID=A0A212RXW8_RHOAC|nr:50S ribosomal protein L11 methyltransferase [Rhodoblastus acidophilus]PPQ38436.1 50S ribosomal protein L11 methyltransferase [Rhodoblastus acidophilus]RAI17258.1 50S ribosomal protein L11 methyltransferase [Rhodoblastus acidophilus]SNB77496.1 [LSU ribosomal protein L11P]-lysine N-methyltransferase [Rhodoblastus acidophilus]